MSAREQELDAIRPDSLYPISVFLRTSGLTRQRIREARAVGIELPTLDVGRRKFVQGAAGIGYIGQLAELTDRSRVAG